MSSQELESISTAALWREGKTTVRRGLPMMVAYEVIFRTFINALGAPLLAWAIGALVERTGSAAVSNDAILSFLLTPAGIAAGLIGGVGYLVGQLLLSSGLLTLAALALADRKVSLGRGLRMAFGSSLRLCRFGLKQLVMLSLVFAPFLGLAGLTYWLLLTGHDINFYLSEKPPAFIAAVVVGVILGLALLCLLTFIYVRGLFILPIMLFQGVPVAAAARESGALTRGSAWRIGAIAVGWHGLLGLLSPLIAAGYAGFCVWVMAKAGTSLVVLVPLASALLAGHVGLVAALAFTQVAGASLWTALMFDARTGGKLRAWAEAVEHAPPQPLRIPRWGWAAGILALLCGMTALGLKLLTDLSNVTDVSVTAHRGSSTEAPENTLAAIRKAIEHRADFAEIDIHLTADGIPIVLHDEDLQRVGGVAKKPAELTLVELQKIDVGSRFSPQFKGETVPTLAAVIAEARGRIKINIELKPTDKGPAREALATKVADLIRAENFEAHCFVTSLDHDAVEIARKRNPRLRTGGIVSASLGDLAKLDVDVLSIRSGLINERLLARVHRQGREVHAWTVDERAKMGELIDEGVDGLITNDPAAAIEVRQERRELPAWQRFVLGFRQRLSGR